MSLVTQIAALATRVAAEIKLLKSAIPTYSGTEQEVLVETAGGRSWSRDLSINSLTVSGMTVGFGGGLSPTNLALGAGALVNNTTGFGLAAVGSDALSANTAGNYNCGIGYSTLASLASGSDNTAVGTLAGGTLTGGNSNTFLGRSAGGLVTTGSSNTIIGRYAGSATMNGTVVIAAGVTVRAWCDNTGRWGFGTNAPTASADVNGDTLRLRSASTPASDTAAGDAGTLRWDSTAIHFCVSQDTWKSLPFSAFGATTPGASGPSGIPVYVQETEPAAPAIWYQTDADGAVVDILRVT